MRAHPPLPRTNGAGTSTRDSVLDRVAEELDAAAAARENQLKALPPASAPVAQAHQDSVRRILTAIRAAQAQLQGGTYGDCHRCGRRTDLSEVPRRPWAPLCSSCQPH